MTIFDPLVVEEQCTLSDGTVLSLDRYTNPGTTGRRPVVLSYTPYLKGDNRVIQDLLFPIDAIVDAGYDVVVADIRGTGGSGGVYQGPHSPQEADDGKELVEWLAGGPNCDGQVALGGISYCGGVQYAIAARRPQGLRCIMPGVAVSDFYRDWTHRGGIPGHQNWAAGVFLQMNQPHRSIKPALDFYYGIAMSTDEDGPAFWERSPERVLADIEVPALLLAGHFDFFSRSMIRAFDRLNVPKRLVTGAWGHQYPTDPGEILRWLDYWLRGIGSDPSVGDNVKTWVLGRDEWRSRSGRFLPDAFERVQVVASETNLSIDASRLAWGVPAGAPREPTDPTDSGMWSWGETSTFDLDVAEGTLIDGVAVLDLTCQLHGATDADVNVRINFVDGTGTTHQLTEGRLRLSHRAVDVAHSDVLQSGELMGVHHPYTAPTGVPENETVNVLIEFSPTCFELPRSAKLQLGVSLCRTDGVSTAATLVLDRATRLCLPVDHAGK